MDIELLTAKVDDYYLKYGELPILCDYTDKVNFSHMIESLANQQGCRINVELNANDGNDYAVIDLEKLGGISLNYGYEPDGDYANLRNTRVANANTDMNLELYVINTTSHQIYFPQGIYVDGVMYYTFYSDKSNVSLNIDAINYTIKYNLAGGTNSAQNPITYTSNDEDITLAEPTKERIHFCRMDRN